MSSPFGILERLRRRRRPEVRVFREYARWGAREVLMADRVEGKAISVLLPVHETPAPYLRAAIGSVLAQTYDNWTLCVADDASIAPHVSEVLREAAASDARVRWVRLDRNAGIAAATNAALKVATGDFVALLDHDDALVPHALARMATEILAHPDASVVFSDEDQLVDGVRCRPYFKPGWNPDLMLCQNLVSHLGVYRTSLIKELGGMREVFEGSQDYDLALRAIAAVPDAQVRHVPEVLYHWRQHEESFSARRLAACTAAARAAVADCLEGIASVEANPEIPQWTRIVYPLPDPAPLVSLVMAPGAAPADPSYGAVEMVSEAAAATGAVLVFLAPGLLAARPRWLRELVSQATRPGIGCVGGRIDGHDGRILEAGLALDPAAIVQTLAPGSDAADPGYFGHFLLARSVSAVSRTCLAVRRDVFEQAGGFDAQAADFADVDFCLRLAERGLRHVWTPHARLSGTRVPVRRVGGAYMRARWADRLSFDRYVNPNLIIRHGNLTLAPLKT